MGKFINTQYTKTVDKFQTGFKELLKNPYYLFNNSHPTTVTYYRINNTESCLDEASAIQYSNIGSDSPFRFTKISDFILFGLDKIQLNLASEDLGLEAGEVSGEAFTLPNTIEPTAGDFFVINHIKEKILFSVDSVNKDTLEDGSNFYNINYRLEQFKESEIQDQVVDKQHLVVNNIGTIFSTTIRDDKYYLIKELDEQCVIMKKYYKSLFFNNRVQTFTFNYNWFNMYDPYMIEFIIRNKLLEGDGEYLFISHQTNLPFTFKIDYDKSIFATFEHRSLDEICSRPVYKAIADYIDDPTTIFQLRMEDFFEVNHTLYQLEFNDPTQRPPITILDGRIIEYIRENNPLTIDHVNDYEDTPSNFYDILYGNVFVDFFNGKDFTKESLDIIKNIEYKDDYRLFYAIPLLIFCIEYYIKKLMA